MAHLPLLTYEYHLVRPSLVGCPSVVAHLLLLNLKLRLPLVDVTFTTFPYVGNATFPHCSASGISSNLQGPIVSAPLCHSQSFVSMNSVLSSSSSSQSCIISSNRCFLLFFSLSTASITVRGSAFTIIIQTHYRLTFSPVVFHFEVLCIVVLLGDVLFQPLMHHLFSILLPVRRSPGLLERLLLLLLLCGHGFRGFYPPQQLLVNGDN